MQKYFYQLRRSRSNSSLETQMPLTPINGYSPMEQQQEDELTAATANLIASGLRERHTENKKKWLCVAGIVFCLVATIVFSLVIGVKITTGSSSSSKAPEVSKGEVVMDPDPISNTENSTITTLDSSDSYEANDSLNTEEAYNDWHDSPKSTNDNKSSSAALLVTAAPKPSIVLTTMASGSVEAVSITHEPI